TAVSSAPPTISWSLRGRRREMLRELQNELHRLTEHRRSWPKRLRLSSIDKPHASIQANSRGMARRDAQPERAQSNAPGPRDHNVGEKPSDATPAVVRGNPDLEKMANGWVVVVAAAPREADWRLVHERNDGHLGVRCRGPGKALLPLCVGAA